MFRIIGAAGAAVAAVGIGATTLLQKRLDCSPTFEGIPTAATLLIFQSISLFEAKFKDKLLISPVFKPGSLNHIYTEKGIIIPSRCSVELPVYEKLPEEEEKRLGKLLIEKQIVGHLVIRGDCKLGCASVTMTSIQLFKVDKDSKPYGTPIWEYRRE
jgi:hypothetical protein